MKNVAQLTQLRSSNSKEWNKLSSAPKVTWSIFVELYVMNFETITKSNPHEDQDIFWLFKFWELDQFLIHEIGYPFKTNCSWLAKNTCLGLVIILQQYERSRAPNFVNVHVWFAFIRVPAIQYVNMFKSCQMVGIVEKTTYLRNSWTYHISQDFDLKTLD